MMRPLLLLLPLLALAIAGCQSMDGFLFNTEKLDHYSLPGNTIPDSLLTPVKLTSDGNAIHGYWVGSDGARPGLTVLYCHGNKHGIDEYWDRVMLLHRTGVNVFIFDYRGYGMSEGTSSEAGMHADVAAALAYLRDVRKVMDDSLVLYGYSLGNVASIWAATHLARPRVLIAESPFASANSLTQGSSVLDIQPNWITDARFDNAAEIRSVSCPLLLLHGEADDFVRYRDNGRVVFENAPEPKRLMLVPGADHTNVPQMIGVDRYVEIIRAFLDGK